MQGLGEGEEGQNRGIWGRGRKRRVYQWADQVGEE